MYLIEYLDKLFRPLVLILPKISGYVKIFTVKDKSNKLMSFHINDKKLLEKFKTIWTKNIMLSLHYRELMRKIEKHEEKNI